MPEAQVEDDLKPKDPNGPALAAVPAQRELPDTAKLTYYIIDDKDLMIGLIGAYLQAKWQLPTESRLGVASSAEEADKNLRTFQRAPDFILLDWSVNAPRFVQLFALTMEDPVLGPLFKDTKIILCSAEAGDPELMQLQAMSPKVAVIGRIQKPSANMIERLTVMLADNGAVKEDAVVEVSRIALIPEHFSRTLTGTLRGYLSWDDVRNNEMIAVAIILGQVNDARRRAKLETLTQFDAEFDAILAAVKAQFPQLRPSENLSMGADLLFAKKAEVAS